MAHPLLNEADRQARQLCARYQIRPHGHHAFRVWRLSDEWQPIQERQTRDECVDYLLNKLPPIESEL